MILEVIFKKRILQIIEKEKEKERERRIKKQRKREERILGKWLRISENILPRRLIKDPSFEKLENPGI